MRRNKPIKAKRPKLSPILREIVIRNANAVTSGLRDTLAEICNQGVKPQPAVSQAAADVEAAMSDLERAAAGLKQAGDVPALDDAIVKLRVRTVELASLLERHPDPLARILSVIRRCAADILGDVAGAPVATWAGNLERAA